MAKSNPKTPKTAVTATVTVVKKTQATPPTSSVSKAAATPSARNIENLEQQRAAFAWERVQGCSKDYTKLAKAAPALIMNNSLMQALAFYQSKGKVHHLALNRHLCEWLHQRGISAQADFASVMTALYQADATTFRQATEETLALLKWIRQFAAAVCGD